MVHIVKQFDGTYQTAFTICISNLIYVSVIQHKTSVQQRKYKYGVCQMNLKMCMKFSFYTPTIYFILLDI